MFILLLLFACSLVKSEHFNKTCDGFQASFGSKDVVGTWHVVAIIPEKLFPDRDINCYTVEFSEIDEGGLRWLINKTKPLAIEKTNKDLQSATFRRKRIPKVTQEETKEAQGIIVRLRYHTEQAFDVWSKSVEGVNGCFTQVLSLDVEVNDTQKARNHDAMMQLHMVQTDDGPYLVQMLWGRLISAVIYRKEPGVTQDQLKPVFKFLQSIRGPQRLPKICDNPMRDLLFFNEKLH